MSYHSHVISCLMTYQRKRMRLKVFLIWIHNKQYKPDHGILYYTFPLAKVLESWLDIPTKVGKNLNSGDISFLIPQ